MANTGIARVLRAESIRPSHRVGVTIGDKQVQAQSWVEHLEADDSLEVLARFAPSQFQSGLKAAWVSKTGTHYLAFDPDPDALSVILGELAHRAGVSLMVRWTKDYAFVLNFGSDAFDPADGALSDPLMDNGSVAPYDVKWFKRG